MEIIEKLNAQINQILLDQEALRVEKEALQFELDSIKNKNDELVRYNQDMLLKIDSTLTLVKGKENDSK